MSFLHSLNPPITFTRSLAVLLLLLVIAPFAQAAGELMVAPTRIVFEGRTRTAQVSIVNTGTETSTYRIAFVRKQMTENGGFEDVPEGTVGMFADPMIRFSPRQVTLNPGQTQVVRLMLRKPSELADGEYRSHLLFRAIPKVGAGIESLDPSSSGNINIQLVPVLGISIPVIVRQGAVDATADLSNLSVQNTENGSRHLLFQIERKGNGSLFGDLTATLFHPQDRRSLVVGLAKGVAVYTSIERRQFRMPLQLPPSAEFTGTLRLTYRRSTEEGEAVLAETELPLP